MLKNTFLSLALAATVAAAAWAPSIAQAGEYDGVWMTEALPGWWMILRENEGVVVAVAVALDPERLPQLKPGTWEAFLGTLDGTTGTGTTVIGESVSNSLVEFTSSTTGTVTITSCAPAELCEFPVGVPFPIMKVL